jgi:integrin alpha FG-GAP repeat containing protein 1
LAIRPGDYNVDGFPDLLLVIGNDTANTGHSVFGGKSTQARVLRNVACHKGVSGCSGKQDRGLQVETGHGWEALDRVTDVTGASWLDIDDDVSWRVTDPRLIDCQGSLDILLLRSGDQDKQKVTFMKNNFYHDAFFLKAQGE